MNSLCDKYKYYKFLSKLCNKLQRNTWPVKISNFPIDDMRPPLLVVSFERSGTHFMMNSMASCFEYIANPWVNFDQHPNYINFYHSPSMKEYLESYVGGKLANIVKSHHPVSFFETFMDYITDHYHIIYIYRDPLHTLRSFWQLIERLEWIEGPKGLTCNEFLRAEPMGNLMRYQMFQEKNMVHRWCTHTTGWYEAAKKYPSITLIKYEELNENFEKTIRKIGIEIAYEPLQIIKPDREKNVILKTTEIDYRNKCQFTEEDKTFVYSVAGRVMEKLGY